MPVSEEHIKLLKKQNEIVSELKDVVSAQERALELLGAVDEDYENAPEKVRAGYDSDNEGELDDLEDAANRASTRTRDAGVIDSAEKGEGNQEYVEPTEEEERGFMAVKPWLGAMAPPSDWSWNDSKQRDEKPKAALDLEFVYGYRARACRNNVARISNDEIVYPAAAVAVVMNVKTNTQRFFRGHDDDIICLDYNAAKRICATGEVGKRPSVCVWSVDDPSKPIAEFKTHKRAVVSVSISPDGKFVISVGLDNEHCISVHNIQTGECVVHTEGDTSRIISAHWNTTGAANSSTQFVTVGRKHLYFWTISGGSVSKKRGLLGRKGEQQSFLCAAFTPENTLVATESGSVYVFEENKLKKMFEAHNQACFSIFCEPSSGVIVTGGRDGFINVWDIKTRKNVHTYDLNKEDSGSGLNSVKGLWMDKERPSQILVGTVCSSLYEIDTQSANVTKFASFHFGDLSKTNSSGELWGLATHPSASTFTTACEDGTLRVWDIATRTCVGRAETGEKAVCANYSPDGSKIAVGFHSGSFAVYYAADLIEITKLRKSKRRIQSIRFSPSGNLLAIGTATNVVYIYDVSGEDNFKYQAKLRGNSSVILHVDFSEDSKFVQTCAQSYELLFYTAETGEQYRKSRDLKDTKWSTFSSILGWNVQGIWPKEADGSDINSVNKSRSGSFLATAEDTGLVKVFNYPCVGSGLDRKGKLRRRPECLSELAHSAHVTRVEFAANDSHVITTGGGDLCAMQWTFKTQ